MIKIFDKFLKKKRNIIINKNNTINIYVCGITPYENCHIGHARIFIFFDIIIRYFKYLGYKVNYIRNITDIDDKIIKKSIINNTNYKNITNKFILEYKKCFKKLNIIEPNFEPRVTKNIKNIIEIIKILIKKKNAYINNNEILFNIKSYKNYGKLSNKLFIKNYKNFILWKTNLKYNFPVWNSPWGKGRPGWHIECSAISNKIFKNNIIDIHGGGTDLIFPHHENEYAQLKCAYSNFKIKNWIHIGTVNYIKKKLSKSNKNINLYNIINKFDKDTIRYFLIKTKYSKPIEYNVHELYKCKNIIYKFYYILSKFNIKSKINENEIKKTKYTKYFIKYINDDFNIPNLFYIFFEMIKKIKINIKINNNLSYNLAKEMKFLCSIIGFLNYNPKYYLKKYKNIHKSIINIKKINKLINIRNNARKNKNWKLSDRIRNFLIKKNIIIIDNKNKSKWKYKLNTQDEN